MKLKNRNILIISPFFSPELISTGKFNTDMALALRDEGHYVTILCSHPLYPKWKTVKSNEQIPGIKILRGGLRVRYPKKTVFRRAILEIWFASFVLKNIFTNQQKTTFNHLDMKTPILKIRMSLHNRYNLDW